MKIFFICILLLWKFCTVSSISGMQSSGKEVLLKSVSIPDTIDFSKHIQPILVSHCSPCHFTGGKMYEKMPFDKAETILSHESGILKRIKKEEENSLIKAFIQENKNKLPAGKQIQ